MSKFFETIQGLCKNEIKVKDSDNENNRIHQTQNQNQEKSDQQNKNQVISVGSTNIEIQLDDNIKSLSSEKKNQQNQVCNQNQSESKDLIRDSRNPLMQASNTFQDSQFQQQSNDLKNENAFNQINQNINQSRIQITHIEASTKRQSQTFKSQDPIQNSYNEISQDQFTSQQQPNFQQLQIRKKELNQEKINTQQPVMTNSSSSNIKNAQQITTNNTNQTINNTQSFMMKNQQQSMNNQNQTNHNIYQTTDNQDQNNYNQHQITNTQFQTMNIQQYKNNNQQQTINNQQQANNIQYQIINTQYQTKNNQSQTMNTQYQINNNQYQINNNQYLTNNNQYLVKNNQYQTNNNYYQNIHSQQYYYNNQNQNDVDYQNNNQYNQLQNEKQISNTQVNYQYESPQKNQNQRFNSLTSSQSLSNCLNDDSLSKTYTQQTKCYHCNKEITQQYFQLRCQHFFCQDCLKDFLKQQAKEMSCYRFQCLCQKEIKLQLLFQQKDRPAEMLKEKMLQNQIIAIKQNIQQKHQLKNCRNKCCQFFVIIQENLDKKYFYCPSCLEKQSEQ